MNELGTKPSIPCDVAKDGSYPERIYGLRPFDTA